MNTTVSVSAGVAAIRSCFAAVEQTLSRFLPTSPLSRLNANSGGWTVVPPLLYRAIEMAVAAAELTRGAFDPTILAGLEAAGYSRSFELGQTPKARPVPAGRWREIQLAPTVGAVFLPPGVRLDLGGLGKGLAVDDAMKLFPRKSDLLVNAGGDIGVRTSSGGRPMLIDIADPFDTDRTLVSFGLYRGGVATSSTLGRRWGNGLHHLIDPLSGKPVETAIVSATVVTERTVWADILAKSVIILGEKRGLSLLREQGCAGLLVRTDGTMVTTPGMEAHFYGSA